jgi:enoyl-CoA hydratase/carnithine racemase
MVARGVLNEIVDDHDVDARALEVAKNIAAFSPRATQTMIVPQAMTAWDLRDAR